MFKKGFLPLFFPISQFYIDLYGILQPCPDSVPHHIAINNRKVLLSSAESREGLAKQVSGHFSSSFPPP